VRAQHQDVHGRRVRGAEGIGQALDISLCLFRYQELATLLIAVLVLVIGVDRMSRLLRRFLGAAS
jgi:phosphonate transport system permease protein